MHIQEITHNRDEIRIAFDPRFDDRVPILLIAIGYALNNATDLHLLNHLAPFWYEYPCRIVISIPQSLSTGYKMIYFEFGKNILSNSEQYDIICIQ